MPGSQLAVDRVRNFLDSLRRHGGIALLLGGAFAAVAAATVSVETPRYTARAELVVTSDPISEVLTDQAQPQAGLANAAFPAGRLVIAQLETRTHVGVRLEVVGPDLLGVTAEGRSPDATVDLANAGAQAIVDDNRVSKVAAAQEANEALKARLAAIDADLTALPASAPESARASLLDRRNAVSQQLEQVTLLIGLERLATVQTWDRAAAASPLDAGGLSRGRAAIVAAVLGIALGAGIGALREQFETRIRRLRDVERWVPDALVIGSIPARSGGRLELPQPDSAEADAYRALAARVLSANRQARVCPLVVVSPDSTGNVAGLVTANLSAALARGGAQVVAVDTDLREPSIEQCFGTPISPGLAEVVRAEVSPEDGIHSVAPEFKLAVLPAGSTDAPPGDVLQSPAFAGMLSHLTTHHDMVIIAAPPLRAGSDAILVSQHARAALLVIKGGDTAGAEARAVVEELRLVGTPLVGIVWLEPTRHRSPSSPSKGPLPTRVPDAETDEIRQAVRR